MGGCLFAGNVVHGMGPTHWAELYSSATGFNIKPRELMLTGERIFNLMKSYIVREGLRREDDSWPDSDDQYPVFNYWIDSMLDFANSGWWWWNYADLGDCRYCIEFSISSSPIGTSPNGI